MAVAISKTETGTALLQEGQVNLCDHEWADAGFHLVYLDKEYDWASIGGMKLLKVQVCKKCGVLRQEPTPVKETTE